MSTSEQNNLTTDLTTVLAVVSMVAQEQNGNTENTIDNTSFTDPQQIQSMLDENKEKLPDELYKNLCNVLLSLHKKEEKQKNIVRLTYIIPQVKNACVHNMWESKNDLVMHCRVKTKIVSFENCPELIQEINASLDDDGYYIVTFDDDNHFGEMDHENNMIEPYLLEIESDSEDEEEETCYRKYIVPCNSVVVNLEEI